MQIKNPTEYFSATDICQINGRARWAIDFFGESTWSSDPAPSNLQETWPSAGRPFKTVRTTIQVLRSRAIGERTMNRWRKGFKTDLRGSSIPQSCISIRIFVFSLVELISPYYVIHPLTFAQASHVSAPEFHSRHTLDYGPLHHYNSITALSLAFITILPVASEKAHRIKCSRGENRKFRRSPEGCSSKGLTHHPYPEAQEPK